MIELKGNKVVNELTLVLQERVKKLKSVPTLAILGVGENPSDLSYKKGILKKAELIGVNVKEVILPIDITKEDFDLELKKLNDDNNVHGILMFRPLPKTLDEEKIRNMIDPKKDIDGCGDLSLAGLLTGNKIGYPPCTAEACIKTLDSYGISLEGKNVTVLGRSLVIGKPVSLMLLNRNATVTICHSKTKDIKEISKKSDILISCMGKLNFVDKEFVNDNQVILDVGINWDSEKGKISGDVNFDEVKDLVNSITPVPGGIGGVTSTILMEHVIDACEKAEE